MTRVRLPRATLLLALAAPAAYAAVAKAPGEGELSAGAATIFDETRNAFGQPVPNLADQHRARFFVGNSFFNENWIEAPSSVTTRDGLGPLFNARSCSSCHMRDGRGRPADHGQAMTTMLLRISLPGAGPHGAPRPDPVYGDQIQGSGLPKVVREAEVVVEYKERAGTFADGTAYSLREPTYRVDRFGYGKPRRWLTSPRVAPAVIGLGLLEAIPEATLARLADPDDRDGDGISGRLNQVWDEGAKAPAVGRFGWKAEQPSVRLQTAAAFLGDMGLTTRLFPEENHSARQTAARRKPSGGTPEVGDDVFDAVVLYSRTLGVPARRNAGNAQVRAGERLFAEARCTACHVPTLETGSVADLPELAGQTIHPYTDLLLHDMGGALGDGRPSFAASGGEWRTAPLWGLGLTAKVSGHTFFLHDGRARNLTEAILWHDGEARGARDRFLNMTRDERAALLRFLESL
jgi:CxxC motif-containing protein (DUF1111 family)